MPALSHAETTIFLILLAASAYGFWWRFGKVVRKIRAAKPDPGFSLHPIGRRVWDFFSEVLLQSKVIAQRPLPGIAHAFVFWGFLAFALVTLNHAAVGLGIGFLDPTGQGFSGWFGRFYFYLAAAFAFTCAVSIAGLFIRRFFIRPRWLGEKLSYESGFIAFLIFALMVTYLGAFFTTDASPTAHALWWLHTLS